MLLLCCLRKLLWGIKRWALWLQIDPCMTVQMATWVTWAVTNTHRRMDDYAASQAAKQWPKLPVPENKHVNVLMLGSGVLGGAAADALHNLGVFDARLRGVLHDYNPVAASAIFPV